METTLLTDITGTLGQWLAAEFDMTVPWEVISALQEAYDLAVKALGET